MLSVRGFTLSVLAVFSLPSTLAAQVLYGSIVGNVRDASDAPIAGARVRAVDKGTGASRESLTDESGDYTFPTVNAGLYEITVQRDGFRTARQAEAAVTTNSVVRADFVLQIGQVTESVEVTAASPALQTDRAEVRAELTSKTLENLPISGGRNYQQVFRTIPGFRPPSNTNSVPTNPSRSLTFNVNGVSRRINNTRIDGATTMTLFENNSALIPTLEAIDVVNVVTNSFDAEQGLAGGAAINVSIKSGTNALHGSAFENYSGNALKAKNFFLPAGERNPKLVYNEFGATLGGPVKKDKLFYFVSYEGTYDRQFASRFGSAPTVAMKAGDMRESTRAIFDPLTGDATGAGRTAFANNIIPASRISPITKKLNDIIPNPNQPGFANNYFATGGYAYDRNRADTKVNYIHSQKLSGYGRFSVMDWTMDNPAMFGQAGGLAISSAGGNQGLGFGRTWSVTGAVTYLINNSLVMDAYYGYTSPNTNVEHTRIEENLGSDFLGIPGTNGSRRMDGGWPRFVIDGLSNLGTGDPFMPYYRTDPLSQYVANFSWNKKSHEVRFGFDLYQGQLNHQQAQGPNYGPQGGFIFSGGVTTNRGGDSANQFNSYAAFLLGQPNRAGKTIQVPDVYRVRQTQSALYIRDRWNISRKVTLSYGVRWEKFYFPTRTDRGIEVYNRSTNLIDVCDFGSTPKDCGIKDTSRFTPRVGIAWRVNDGFIVRAGYGITNDPFPLADHFRANYPVVLFQELNAPNAFVAYDSRGIAAGLPAAAIPDLGSGTVSVPGNYTVRTVDNPVPRGYVQSWNFTVQKQMKWGFVGQVGYVATRATSPIGSLNVNAGQVPGTGQNSRPFFQRFGRTADVSARTSWGTGMYDSMQATLERRFAAGLQLNVAYTWSKSISYISDNDGPQVNALAFLQRNRSLTPFDRPHNLQITNIWELPFGKGKRWASSGFLSHIVGGWQTNNVLSFFSGNPFSVTADGGTLNMPGSAQTADQVLGEVVKLGGVGRGAPYFNPDAFIPVREARFGNTGYNILRGPGTANWDFGVFRNFRLNERFRMEFRAEAFNFTNTPHFSNPGSNVSNYNPTVANPLTRYGGYMEITSTANNLGRDGFDERQFRLGLRLAW
ncbi:MAG: TonB-dependent receptor [Bryobacteraceae bacterium]|nr:TonB-dependent receptor [Bryobacteraceae bacterium]